MGVRGAEVQMSMPVDVSVESSIEGIVNGEDRADTYGRDPGNRLMTNFLNLSLDFFDLRVEDNFIVRLSTPSSPHTSRSFSSILHVNRYDMFLLFSQSITFYSGYYFVSFDSTVVCTFFSTNF
jgi:hypothetical protein